MSRTARVRDKNRPHHIISRSIPELKLFKDNDKLKESIWSELADRKWIQNQGVNAGIFVASEEQIKVGLDAKYKVYEKDIVDLLQQPQY